MKPTIFFSLTALLTPLCAQAQTLDIVTLDAGIALTIEATSTSQVLRLDGEIVLEGLTVAKLAPIETANGRRRGAVLGVLTETEDCTPDLYVAALNDLDSVTLLGPLGLPCVHHDLSTAEDRVTFIAAPSFQADGIAFAYDLNEGLIDYGTLRYTPQRQLGWSTLRGEDDADIRDVPVEELPIQNDLYAYTPIYAQLRDLWGGELFIYAQHFGARGTPTWQDGLVYQPGCILSQCAFAIGLLVADPTNERVFSAYLNEGAPDIRPPLEEWNHPALALFESWRRGDLR